MLVRVQIDVQRLPLGRADNRPDHLHPGHGEELGREAPGHIVTTVVPGESNFADGRAEWLIEAVDDSHTRISVNARQTPTFWIPPVIGPMLLRHVFLREVQETRSNIERIAQSAAPRHG